MAFIVLILLFGFDLASKHLQQPDNSFLKRDHKNYTCVTCVACPLLSLPQSVRLAIVVSSWCMGNHLSKHFGRNRSLNVVRNCRLIEQYSMKLIAELISARMSMKSPEKKEEKILLLFCRNENFMIYVVQCQLFRRK